MIGKKFSNGWKIRRIFSNDWKKCFQWLENSAGGHGRVVFGLREDWRGW